MLLLAPLFVSRLAFAHGADANQIQLVVHEAVGELVATPPVDFAGLRFADEDADGLLTLEEMKRHRPAVREALVAALGVFDEAGRPARVERADVSLPSTPTMVGGAGRDFVRLTLRLIFEAPPRAVRIVCRFAGEHPVHVLAHRADGRSEPGRLNLAGGGESAVIDARHPEAVVFGMAAPARTGAPAGWTTFAPWILPVLLLVTLVVRVLSDRRRRRRATPGPQGARSASNSRERRP